MKDLKRSMVIWGLAMVGAAAYGYRTYKLNKAVKIEVQTEDKPSQE